jgi:hypothetical protein
MIVLNRGHVLYHVTDESKKNSAVFTGDTLFVAGFLNTPVRYYFSFVVCVFCVANCHRPELLAMIGLIGLEPNPLATVLTHSWFMYL